MMSEVLASVIGVRLVSDRCMQLQLYCSNRGETPIQLD